MNLNHLHIHVRDRAAAEQFYSGWFKLSVYRRGQRLSFLKDTRHFELALMDDPNPQVLPAWFHFGFHLETAGAVISLHNEMACAGVSIIKTLYRDATIASFHCADPDGYAIEVYWEMPDALLD